MEWIKVLAVVLGNLAIMIWCRYDSHRYWKKIEKDIEEIKKDSRDFRMGSNRENKEFHWRILTLERKNKGQQ